MSCGPSRTPPICNGPCATAATAAGAELLLWGSTPRPNQSLRQTMEVCIDAIIKTFMGRLAVT